MASAEVQHAGNLSGTGWEASIELGFSRRNERTVLAEKRQYGPLTVQRSFYPEGDVCHLYLLHPPGGIAGGDRLEVQVTTSPESHALITTPGAAKFYRSSGPTASTSQQFYLTGGTLEWLPQENIFFPGAQVEMLTEINLSDGANYIGWEIHCLGRPVISERFEHGRLISKTVVKRDGKPLLIDRLVVDGEHSLDGKATLRGRPVTATLIASGADSKILETAREIIGEVSATNTAVTLLADILVCRYLG